MKNRRALATAVLAWSVVANAAALSPGDMREDLRFLRDVWSHEDQSLTPAHRDAFDEVLDDISARADTLSPDAFALEVSRAVAIGGNAHSDADIGAYLHGLPVGFAWFADGLFVVRTEPRHADLLGARVEELGSLPSEVASNKAGVLVSGTDVWKHNQSAIYLRTLEVLKFIGATRNVREAQLTLRLRDGRRKRVTMSAESIRDPAPLPDWMGAVPAPRDLPGRWTHVLDAAPTIPSAWRGVTSLEHEWWQDGRVFYMRSNYIYGTEANRYDLFANLIGVLQVEVAERRPKFAIVDLRLNHGGDFFNTVSFAEALPKLIPADGRIFVLVGPDTFSAALVTAAMLKGYGGDNVSLVGETMGDGAVFWSEGRRLTLPHSGISVGTGRKKQNWEATCTDRDVCYWGNIAFGPEHVSLEPTIHVETRFADYAAGRDPVVEAALAAMSR